MTDAFISYSRKNIKFVKKLNDSLNELERNIWVDFEDILPSTDWLQEIYRAIETSDNFMFVISPDSLVSEYCMLELNYAVEHGKRIFPLYYQEADISNHPNLSSHQFIMFDGSIPYEQAIEQINTALDINLEWVRFHTELLKRALQWQNEGNESSYDLHGEELKNAQNWLEQVEDDWDPQPTALQKNYVVASRKAEKNRRRNTLVSIVATLVFAGLAIFGFVESKLATDQARISTAYLIGAKADQSTEPGLALLLSLHAVDVVRDEQTYSTLFSNFSRFSELRRIIYGIEENVIQVLFSHDSTQIITLEEEEEISIWDVESNELIHEFYLEDNEENPFTNLALHPTQNVLAASLKKGLIIIFDLDTKNEIVKFPLPDRTFDEITYSPDGSQIAAATEESMLILDSQSGEIIFEEPIRDEKNSFLSIAYNLDGTLLAAGDKIGQIHLWDLTNDYAYTAFTAQPGELFAIAFATEPTVLFTGGRDIELRTWDVVEQRMIHAAPFEDGHTAPIYTLDYDPNRGFLVTAGEDLKIQVWFYHDEILRLVKSLTGHTSFINSLGFSDDGLMFASGSLTTVNIWETETKPPGTLIGHTSPIYGLATNADQSTIYSAGDQGQAFAWDQWNGTVTNQIDITNSPTITDIDTNQEGDLVALGGEDGIVYLWKPQDDQPFNTYDFEDEVTSVALNHEGTIVAMGGYYESLSLWKHESGESWEVSWAYGEDGDQVSDIVFHPTRNWVVSSWWSGNVLIWNIDTGEIIQKFHVGDEDDEPQIDEIIDELIEEEEEEDNVEKALSLVFNEDGNILFIGTSHGVIHQWVYNSEFLEYEYSYHFEGHSNWVNSLDYDPNHKRLVSTGEDSLIIVWDLRINNILSSMQGHTGGIPRAIFFDRGDMIASGDRDGNIILWMIDPDDVSDKICKIVNRSLTLDEWERVIKEQDYFTDACAGLVKED